MNNYYIRVFILFVLVLIEVLSSTFWMDTMPIESCRWLYLLSGLGISFYLMLRPIHREQSTSHQSLRWIPFILLLILVLWVVPSFYKIYISNALDYTHADMLPVIRVMCNRWLQHEDVYSIIPDFWNGTTPIYLPAMWMPFIPATLFSFDLRWITLGLMCIGIIFIFLRKNNSWIALLFFLFIGLWFDYLIHNRTETFRLSQEGVVYFYMIILVLSIYYEQSIFIGISIALCLLSRYGIVFFAGGTLFCLFIKYGVVYIRKTILSGGILGLVFMTISGAWYNMNNFIGLPNQYLSSISQNQSKFLSVVNESLGIASYFDMDQTSWLLRIMVILLILITIVMIVSYKKNRHGFYLLAFLKLTLVIFYNLMIIPYQYLMYSSIIVSMTLFYLYANHDDKQLSNLVV